MNKQITRLAVAGVGLIVALIVATTYWQTWAAAGLADRQDNAIQRVAQFTIERGEIRGNGVDLARRTGRRRRAAARSTSAPIRSAGSPPTSSATRRRRAPAPGSSGR